MIDPLQASVRIATSGLDAQSTRLRVVAENLANANSIGRMAGAEPYRRKTVTFDSALDAESGSRLVNVKEYGFDSSPYRVEHDPGHPSADPNGNVRMPNVNMLVEMADMRETNRSYEANLQVVKQVRAMAAMTIDLLRGT
jgi:flagellar basal-body rod protein FlgC